MLSHRATALYQFVDTCRTLWPKVGELPWMEKNLNCELVGMGNEPGGSVVRTQMVLTQCHCADL
jgi:hypothetical protein